MSALSASASPVFGSTRYGHCDEPASFASTSRRGLSFPAE